MDQLATFKMTFRLLAGLIALIVVAGTSASASDFDPNLYIIHRIPVDVTDKTATIARTRAIQFAQREALAIIFRKLVADADQDKLPALGSRELESLMLGFEVHEEKRSLTRYIADVTISFQPDALHDLFLDLQVAFTETAGPRTLIVPVIRDGAVLRMGAKAELWVEAWKTAGVGNFLVPFSLFDEDPDTPGTPPVIPLISRSPAHYIDWAGARGAQDLMIAIVRMELDPITSRRALYYELRHSLEDQRISGVLMAENDLETDADLMNRAALMIASEMEQDWKSKTIIASRLSTRIMLRSPVEETSDWAAVRNRLAEVGVIQSFRLARLALPYADIIVEFVGDDEQLALALEQNGLALVEGKEGRLILLQEKEYQWDGAVESMLSNDLRPARRSNPKGEN